MRMRAYSPRQPTAGPCSKGIFFGPFTAIFTLGPLLLSATLVLRVWEHHAAVAHGTTSRTSWEHHESTTTSAAAHGTASRTSWEHHDVRRGARDREPHLVVIEELSYAREWHQSALGAARRGDGIDMPPLGPGEERKVRRVPVAHRVHRGDARLGVHDDVTDAVVLRETLLRFAVEVGGALGYALDATRLCNAPLVHGARRTVHTVHVCEDRGDEALAFRSADADHRQPLRTTPRPTRRIHRGHAHA